MMSASFPGFGRATFDYLKELQANNDKAWFEANRERYDEHYVAAALSFIEAVSETAAALDPPHQAKAKINGSLRRIHRDVRFSRDKTPFNARLHMVFWCGGHPNRSPALHIVLRGGGVGYGAGQWALDAKGLEAWRKALADGKAVAELREAMAAAQSIGCTLTEPALKRPPKGFEAAGGAEDLLLQKSLVMRTHEDVPVPKALMSDEAVDWFAGLGKKLAPLNGWLARHVGD